MLEGDVEERFSNAEFRQFVDPTNLKLVDGNMLTDLAHAIIHQGISVGVEDYAKEQEKLRK